jgi:hypothetical protein
MKVGDLITTFWAGYFELVKIIPRYKIDKWPWLTYDYKEGQTYKEGLTLGDPIFVIKQKYRSTGVKYNSTEEKECSAEYCELATTSINKEINLLNEKVKRLNIIYNENTNK